MLQTRFCESGGGPNSSGDEVLHLPGLVDAAESSPTAAREASVQIRRYLSRENFHRPHVQYNAIMLVRILSDNPGLTFTRNLDVKFAAVYKDVLRSSKDPGVQQLARETVEVLVTEKAADPGMVPLREMWTKEKEKETRSQVTVSRILETPPGGHQQRHIQQQQQQLQHYQQQQQLQLQQQQQQNYFARHHHRPHGLPTPEELAARVEEAKMSAKLLLQVVQSTPSNELLHNDLIKEFAERCQSASRSIQGYIHAEQPPPDDDTLLTLIETNDQLTLAMSKHQRAVLQARKVASSAMLTTDAPPGSSTGAADATAASTATLSPPPMAMATAATGSQEQPLLALSLPPPQQYQREPINPFSDEHQVLPATSTAPLQITQLDRAAPEAPPKAHAQALPPPHDSQPVSPSSYDYTNFDGSGGGGSINDHYRASLYQSHSPISPHPHEPFHPGHMPAQTEAAAAAATATATATSASSSNYAAHQP
ncbi:MAG: hypothetical protein M1826_001993 [Phylliscum demangeonii]|nr:MAG: hypothetical protein M1826_001993 [Phylliscum demangeonii]